MIKHKCKESSTCCCNTQILDPNESCPTHGAGEWPPRCYLCGRFMMQPVREMKIISFGDFFKKGK